MHPSEGQGSSTDTTAHRRKHAWTFTHGFYAAMGGFVIDTSPTPLWGTHTRFTLTPLGLVWIMKHAPHLIPDISEKNIRDRSKADSVAKALLVWQVFYFVFSCATRRAQSLPLSLFEVSTLAHAVCTIVTYVVWWRKPLNIEEPTLIQGTEAREVAALLLMGTPPTAWPLGGLLQLSAIPEICHLLIRTRWSGDVASASFGNETFKAPAIRAGQPVHVGRHTFTLRSTHHVGTLSRMIIFFREELPWFVQERGDDGKVPLEETDILRWTLAEGGMERLEIRGMCDLPGGGDFGYYIAPDTGLKASEFMLADVFDLTRQATITGVGIMTLYGLPHFFGWNSHFSREIERRLWRISTVVLTLLGSFYGLLGLLKLEQRSSCRLSPILFTLFTNIISIGTPILYAFASGYLFGEGLRQLIVLPAAAFQLPELSIYLPSFS